MEEKRWLVRSQNLYIIRALWKEYSNRSMDAFYDLIGIHDSIYSSFIRKPETDADAIHKIEKNKAKIEGAGFKYKWFTGEISLCDSGFMIKEAEWKAFVNAKRGTDIYNKVADKINEHIDFVRHEDGREYNSVYKVILTFNPNKIASQLGNYLKEIDLSSVSEDEIDGLVALTDKMEQFISDVKAIKRYYEIMRAKK